MTGSKNQNLLVIIISECAFTVTQPFGVITSPGFPQLYQNWLDCTWNIQLPIGQLIQFNFLHFDIHLWSGYPCMTNWYFAFDIFSNLINNLF